MSETTKPGQPATPRTAFQRGQLQQGLAMRLALERARQAQPVSVQAVTSRVSTMAPLTHTDWCQRRLIDGA